MKAFLPSALRWAAIAGAAFLAALPTGTFAADSRQYYELRVYSTKSQEQQKLVADYWRDAAVPAYNRMEIQPIGVFTELQDSPTNKIYVLIPCDSLEVFADIPARLAADTAYQAAAALGLSILPAMSGPDEEFIRVAPDQWSFETSVSQTRFVPFGANFVLNDKRSLNLFGPSIYDPKRYERALTALEKLRFITVKVFLPIGRVLPDPQVPGEASIAPGYLDNLEDFLRMAHRRHIRVVVCLACWGGHGLKWWHEGGEYFGRNPWRNDPGIDSLDVLVHFWTKLGARLRDNSTVFSYTPGDSTPVGFIFLPRRPFR